MCLETHRALLRMLFVTWEVHYVGSEGSVSIGYCEQILKSEEPLNAGSRQATHGCYTVT